MLIVYWMMLVVGYRKMIRDMGSFAITPIVTALMTLFMLPLISRLYPTEEYGKINLFYSTALLLMYLFSLGLDAVCIRFFFEPEKLQKSLTNRHLFGFAFTLSLSLTVVVGCLCAAFASNQISSYLFGESNAVGVVLLFIFTGAMIVFRLLNVIARMEIKAFKYNVQCITQNVLSRVLFVMMISVSTSYFPAISFMALTLAVAAIVFFLKESESFDFMLPRIKSETIKTIVMFGMASMTSVLVLQLNTSLGKFVLTGIGRYDDVGIYAIATTAASAFNVLPTAFGTYWSPFMYKNYKKEAKTIKDMHDCLIIASIIIVITLMLFQDALYFLIGGDYSASQMYFMLVMLIPISSFVCETTSYGIPLSNQMHLNALAAVVGVLVNLCLEIILVPAFGALGAGIGVAASGVVMGALRSVWGQKRYSSINNWKRTLTGCALLIALCVSNCFIWSSLILRIIACGCVFVITCVLYNKSFHQILNKVKYKKS